MKKIVVLGAGGWGLALALTAYDAGNSVAVWSPFEDEVNALVSNREHKKLLPGISIPAGIEIVNDISVVNGADITIIAVPSNVVGQTAARLKGLNCGIIVNVSKGIDSSSLQPLSQIIKQAAETDNVAVLSGPSHAEEVSRKIPTSVVASSRVEGASAMVQDALSTDYFRIYTNDDMLGVELGGAIKNVIAVAAGIINGLNLGDNTKAALITRGVCEITRLGVAMGASINTFSGLSGLGDLIVTCTSEHSRNNRFGQMLGRGEAAEKAVEAVGTVEGYYAAKAVIALAEKYNVEMPICRECYEVIYNGKKAEEALCCLMSRPKCDEHETLLN